MKKFMITGGMLGFLIGLVFGLIEQSAWPGVLWRASVAAFVAGLLLRWWGRLWVQCIQESYETAAACPKPDQPSSAILPPKP